MASQRRYGKMAICLWIALFVCLSAFYWIVLPQMSVIIDDSFISFRYAKHFVEGKGLVFNEGERVEGYTNFLWVLVMSLGYKAGAYLPTFSQAVSTLCAALLVVAVTLFCRSYFRDQPFPLLSYIGALLLALNPLYIEHIGTGMETVLFALLLFVSLRLFLNSGRDSAKPYLTGIFLGLAYLTRPDAIIWAFCFVVVDILQVLSKERKFREQAPIVLKYGTVFALIVLFHLAWRLNYYGDWVPNTYRAKGITNWVWGIQYTGKFLLATGGLALIAALGGPLLLRKKWAVSMALIICMTLLHNLRIGGDFIFTGRFLFPTLPLIYILTQEMIRHTLIGQIQSENISRLRKTMLVGLRIAIPIMFLAGVIREYDVARKTVRKERRTNRFVMQIAECLKENTTQEDTIAVISAGIVPYVTERRCIDMLGLNDRHIARYGIVDKKCYIGHQRAEPDYVLDRRPEIIYLPTDDKRGRTFNAGVVYMLQNPRFLNLYEPTLMECGETSVTFYTLRHSQPDDSASGSSTDIQNALPAESTG